MKYEAIVNRINSRESCLCIGLDPEQSKLPNHLKEDKDGILKFCKGIIDATSDLAVAFKPNLAFFECLGPRGWEILEEVTAYIPDGIFKIADAKRGDIGNTSRMYAQCFFERMNFDAVTVAPYMGEDSVRPFMEFDEKWVILLGLTSNPGSSDFQYLKTGNNFLYEEVLLKASSWANESSMMFVVGATHPERMEAVRSLVPKHFLLVPGIGAQGGNLEAVIGKGKNDDVGLLVNSSRGIIYAGHGEDYQDRAFQEANKLCLEMKKYLRINHAE